MGALEVIRAMPLNALLGGSVLALIRVPPLSGNQRYPFTLVPFDVQTPDTWPAALTYPPLEMSFPGKTPRFVTE